MIYFCGKRKRKTKPVLFFVRFDSLDNHHNFGWEKNSERAIFCGKIFWNLVEKYCSVKNSRHTFSSFIQFLEIFIENNVLGAKFGAYIVIVHSH